MSIAASLALRIRTAATVTAPYELPDGTVIDEYFDEYRVAADPALLGEVGTALACLVPAGVDVLAGLELGGVPFALATSAAAGLPLVLVRKIPKSYGTRRQVEGRPIGGARVAMVDDVVRSGGQMLAAVRALTAAGGRTTHALAVLARPGPGRTALAGQGISLRSLLTDADQPQPVSLRAVR
ncbi:MAG: orotate phosphoribosyltransferase [Micromonosporaceae bacterium]|nr:orotate phosphoribosyltransferase [Micromonosporaceae bacterium]